MKETINHFKTMESNEQAPQELREKVMRDVNHLQSVADVGDLFFMKYAETVETLFPTDTVKEEGKVLE